MPQLVAANPGAHPLPDAHDGLSAPRQRLQGRRLRARRRTRHRRTHALQRNTFYSILYAIATRKQLPSCLSEHVVARAPCHSAAALQGRSRAPAPRHGAAAAAGAGAGVRSRGAVRLIGDRGAFAGPPVAGGRAGRDARLVADGGAHRRIRRAVRAAGFAAQASRGRVVSKRRRDGHGRGQAHRHGRAVAFRGVADAQRHAASGASPAASFPRRRVSV